MLAILKDKKWLIYHSLWILWALLFVIGIFLISHTDSIVYSQNINHKLNQINYYVIFILASNFFFILLVVKNHPIKLNRLACLVVIFAHMIVIISPAILEDDYYRYSLDGRNLRMGIHPFQYAPADLPKGLRPPYYDQINNKSLRTIYPPLVQLFFISEVLSPNTYYGWWCLLIIIDVFLIISSYGFLKNKKYGGLWFYIIWLNPIWLKEALNSGHLDILGALFIYLSVKYYAQCKTSTSFIWLGFLAGVRPWFLALYLWNLKAFNKKSFYLSLFIFFFPWFLLFYFSPLNIADTLSSWKTFVKKWEFNALFYDHIYRFLKFLELTNFQVKARITAWICGFAVLFWYWLRYRKEKNYFFYSMIGLIWWISFQPTPNAWYFIPILFCFSSFLVFIKDNIMIAKSIAIMCGLSVTLSMSYLHYADIDRSLLNYLWPIAQISLGLLIYSLIRRRLMEKDFQ